MRIRRPAFTWTPERDAELLDMRARGETHADIAEHFDIDINTVGRRCRVLARHSVDIPITVDEPENLPHASKPCGDENPRERVDAAARAVASAADAYKSTRSEWSVAGASRERTLERDAAELRRQNKALLDELRGREAQLGIATALRSVVDPILATSRKPGSKRHGVPVMLISDLHVEEPVDPAKVNGLNKYDLKIADACIAQMADAYEWMLRDSRYDCREGVVWLGGDLYSGFIHEELMEANLLSPVQALVWLQHRFIGFFQRILKETSLERIVVVCNDGNHGRLTHRMRVQTRTENSLEWLLYQQLAQHYVQEPRLQFQIADGVSNYLKVYGSTFCFQHGDTFDYKGGVGGLSIPVRRGANELRKYKHFDHLVIGHFHQRLDMGDIVVNGSGIGITPYGIKIKATPEPRQQSWFLVDQERGKSLSAPVWLPQAA